MVQKQSNGKHRITFNSQNGEPVFIWITTPTTSPKAYYLLKDEDKINGYVDIDIEDIVSKQYNNLSNGDTYVKVVFKGDYGRASNAKQKILL